MELVDNANQEQGFYMYYILHNVKQILFLATTCYSLIAYVVKV